MPNVSIHAPARGATHIVAHWATAGAFQSTHPHGVRLNSLDKIDSQNYVSIHAPARGATPRPTGGGDVCHVSIHAPARGATNLIV